SFAPPPSARRDSKKGYSASLHTPFYYRFLLFFVLFDFLSTPTIDMEPFNIKFNSVIRKETISGFDIQRLFTTLKRANGNVIYLIICYDLQ
ncbi:MAG: hypothetical protein IJ457_10085, partial [Clostridia bacterium]|nr:hypothetical protein [Clostridia bacterium]